MAPVGCSKVDPAGNRGVLGRDFYLCTLREIDECEQARPPRTGSGARLYGAISSAGYVDSPRVPAALYKDRSGLRTPHAGGG